MIVIVIFLTLAIVTAVSARAINSIQLNFIYLLLTKTPYCISKNNSRGFIQVRIFYPLLTILNYQITKFKSQIQEIFLSLFSWYILVTVILVIVIVILSSLLSQTISMIQTTAKQNWKRERGSSAKGKHGNTMEKPFSMFLTLRISSFPFITHAFLLLCCFTF